MSDVEQLEPYVYQPFGMYEKEHWKAKAIYGVGAVGRFARIEGLTKEEATVVCEALKSLLQRDK